MTAKIQFNQTSLEQKIMASLMKDFGTKQFEQKIKGLDEELFIGKTYRSFVKYAVNQKKFNLPIDLEQFMHEIVDKDVNLHRGDMDVLSTVLDYSDFYSYLEQLSMHRMQHKGVEEVRELYHALSVDPLAIDMLEASNKLQKNMVSFSNPTKSDSFDEGSDSFIEMLEKEWANERLGIGRVKSGIDAFDKKYSGFKDGELIILGARPSMGKTSIALSIALGAINRNSKLPIIFFSGEMSPTSLRKKLVAMYSLSLLGTNFIPLSAIVQFSGYEVYRDRIKEVSDKMVAIFNERLKIIDSVGKDIIFIRKEMNEIHNKYNGIDIAFIDYLQIIKLQGKAARHEEIGDTSRECKILASEFECPLVVLAQLNRELEKRDNKRPLPSDLKDSGSIEQDADVIMFVYRDSVYKKEELKQKGEMAEVEALESRPKDPTELIIAKNRNGPVGTVTLDFHTSTTMFIDKEEFKLNVGAPVPEQQNQPQRVFNTNIVVTSGVQEVVETANESIEKMEFVVDINSEGVSRHPMLPLEDSE